MCYAKMVANFLKEQGISYWLDTTRLEPGSDWFRDISVACDQSLAVIPILTPQWQLSEWTKFETYVHTNVYPIIFRGEVGEVFTPPIQRFQALSLDLRLVPIRDAISHGQASDPLNSAQTKGFLALKEYLLGLQSLNSSPEKPSVFQNRFPAHDYFTGRIDVLRRLAENLFQSPKTCVSTGKACVLTGTGGLGKSTIANEFVHRFWRCYQNIFWIDCGESFEGQFANLAEKLQLDRSGSDYEKSVAALDYLNQRISESEKPSLLILDDATDCEQLQTGFVGPNQKCWIPNLGSCHVVITSRCNNWPGPISHIELELLSSDASVDLLKSSAGRTAKRFCYAEKQAMRKLAEDLEYLPLALEAAGAYIRNEDSSFGFEGYRELLETGTHLLQRHRRLWTDYPQSVYKTWNVTVENKLSAGAKALLRTCSWLGNAVIPDSMILHQLDTVTELASKIDRVSVESKERPLVKGVLELRDELVSYSMARIAKTRSGTDGFDFHKLIWRVQRDQLTECETERGNEQALKLVVDALPENAQNSDSWPKMMQLRSHCESLLQTGRQLKNSNKCGDLYRTLGVYLMKRNNNPPEALKLFKDGIEAECDCLAGLWIDRGVYETGRRNYSQARGAYRKAIDIQLRSLNIETTLGDSIELVFEKLAAKIDDFDKMVGELNEVRLVLSGIHNIAGSFSREGNISKARPIAVEKRRLRQMLLEKSTNYGQGLLPGCTELKRDLLRGQNDLAVLDIKEGSYKSALSCYHELFEARKNEYGINSLETSKTARDIGTCSTRIGRFSNAWKFLNLAVTVFCNLVRDKTIDSKNADVFKLFNNICFFLLDLGLYDRVRNLVSHNGIRDTFRDFGDPETFFRLRLAEEDFCRFVTVANDVDCAVKVKHQWLCEEAFQLGHTEDVKRHLSAWKSLSPVKPHPKHASVLLMEARRFASAGDMLSSKSKITAAQSLLAQFDIDGGLVWNATAELGFLIDSQKNKNDSEYFRQRVRRMISEPLGLKKISNELSVEFDSERELLKLLEGLS